MFKPDCQQSKLNRLASCHLGALVLLFSYGIALAENPISVLTERSPLTVTNPSQSDGGEATTFVKQVLEGAGMEYEITYVPWKRSFQYARQSANVLIYPIARTAARENDFIWVGNLIPANYQLFKLASRTDIQLSEIDAAEPLTIGVVNHHAHHEYLLSKGFSNFQPVNNNAQNLKKLVLGRIDLFPLSKGGLEPLCKQTAIDCSNIVPAIALEDFSDGLYMAFSKGSTQSTVDKIKTSFQKQRALPAYQKLFAKRLSAIQQANEPHNPE